MLHDPIFAWLIPEERARRSLLPGLMSSIIAESLASDSVLTDISRRGFAVLSERNAALYAQRSFTPLGDPITLPHGPDLRPMWREP